jgi:hypothetical protein
MKSNVIPAEAESWRWIPGSRFAAPGMTRSLNTHLREMSGHQGMHS